jgi:hypothetical protein
VAAPAATNRVPNLQLYGLVVDADHARAKLHPNRQVVHGLEPLVRELQKETGLAHARVSYDDVLEEVGVRHDALR